MFRHYVIHIWDMRYPYMRRMFHYHSKFFLDRKFTTSCLSRGSIHQGHEGFSGQSRGKQCSFMRLSALLTTQTIPVIEWNSTTIDNTLVQGDNMYFCMFLTMISYFLVRDFCRWTTYQPLLRLFVVDRFCACLCRQVYKGFALFYVDICAFPFVFLCFNCASSETS